MTMAFEIERKFLVDDLSFKNEADDTTHILQTYISINPDSTVRLRIVDDKNAYITIKSRNKGAVRHEWEYEIEVDDAKQMIELCASTPLIDKIRYRCGRWEVDMFAGVLSGLIVAEIELTDEDESFARPAWLGKEVTGDKRYYNSSLATATSVPLP